MPKNPNYVGLIRKAKDHGEPFCPKCYSALVSPSNCAVCHGNNGFSTFCPNCDEDCGCVEWA